MNKTNEHASGKPFGVFFYPLTDEHASGEPFDVFFYHVTDKNGMHRFFTMNSLDIESMGGIGSFEEVLATQFQAFDLLGSSPISILPEDWNFYRVLDSDGLAEIHRCVLALMAAIPSSHCHCDIEPWVPNLHNVNNPYSLSDFVTDDFVGMVVTETFPDIWERRRAQLETLKGDTRRIVEGASPRVLTAFRRAPGLVDRHPMLNSSDKEER